MQLQLHYCDPAFAEYVFNCMQLANVAKRMQLDPEDLVHFSTHKAMRRFADTASLEEKMRLIGQLGYSFCIVASDPSEDIAELIPDLPIQFDSPLKQKEMIEAMVRRQSFVLSTRDALLSLHIASTNSHNKLFVLNYKYAKVYDKLTRLDKFLGADRHDDAIKGLMGLARLAYLSLVHRDLPRTLTGLKEDEMIVLLVLYQHRSFMTHIMVHKNLEDEMSMESIRVIMRKLNRSGMIRILRGNKKQGDIAPRGIIMEPGMNAVDSYLKYLVRHALSME